jgi:uncharacterized protein
VVAYVLLGLGVATGLLAIPFGLPGLWLELVSLVTYGRWSKFAEIGPAPLVILAFIALTAELIEVVLLAPKMDEKARRRIGFAGLAGAGAGAALGVPFPLVGSIFGAYAGSILGAMLGSIRAKRERSGCLSYGADLLGISTKVAAGVIIGVFTLLVLAR